MGILDDHQSTVDGYLFRLGKLSNISVEATASFGEDLDKMLVQHELDLLLLDVSIPTSRDNSSPYPILHKIPQILQKYPEIAIIVITMHNQRTLIEAVMEAGASGYILKDDRESILHLGDIITSVTSGGIYFSEQSYQLLNGKLEDGSPNLTPRQQEVLSLIASKPNATTADLAKNLDIAPSTVRNLLSDAYVRLKVSNKTAAVVKARTLGLITPFTNQS
jgi:DNA-binding NarL/FixJ family response regulator